jgi:hypothetical protein
MKTKATAVLGMLAMAAAVATAFVPAAGASAAAGPQTGASIHVDGRWTVTVRDRSGEVVSTRRFENALVGPGQERLISLLIGVSVAPANGAGWGIVWQHTVPQGQTTEAVPTIKVHHIVPTGWAAAQPYLANITLDGSVSATTATQLVAVGTRLSTCGGAGHTTATCTPPATPSNFANFTVQLYFS